MNIDKELDKIKNTLKTIKTKNIIFEIEDMSLLERWIKAVVSDICLHLIKDMGECQPGKYQIGWTINEIISEVKE